MNVTPFIPPPPKKPRADVPIYGTSYGPRISFAPEHWIAVALPARQERSA